jgi:hypothetical protein
MYIVIDYLISLPIIILLFQSNMHIVIDYLISLPIIILLFLSNIYIVIVYFNQLIYSNSFIFN